jgi:hypothetical protein
LKPAHVFLRGWVAHTYSRKYSAPRLFGDVAGAADVMVARSSSPVRAVDLIVSEAWKEEGVLTFILTRLAGW